MIKKKYIFLIFRNNFRQSTIGNFGKTNSYGDIKLISLSGRIKSIFGRILYFFKLGKFISIDGDPFLEDEKNSINIWFTGTSLRITKKFRDFEMIKKIAKENNTIHSFHEDYELKKYFKKK